MAQKDYATAENDYQQAIAVSPAACRRIGLCSPISTVAASTGPMWTAAIQNCVNAAAKNPHSGVALYDGAGVLIASNRDPVLAAQNA